MPLRRLRLARREHAPRPRVLPHPPLEVELGLEVRVVGVAEAQALGVEQRHEPLDGRQLPLRDVAREIAVHLDRCERRRAAALRGDAAPGRFEFEAAIQAVHLDRRRTGTVDWAALRRLYLALVAVAPSLGSRVALAAVIGRTDGAAAGLAALPPGGEAFQPWWATRAELLMRAGDADGAVAAYERAIDLTENAVERAFLAHRRDALRP